MNIQSVGVQSYQGSNNSPSKPLIISSKKEFSLGLPKKEKIDETKETLGKMLDNIQQLKNQMDFDLTVENVMKYKQVVKSFMQYYVENALQTKDIINRNGRNNERLTIVKKIDDGIKELDDAMSLLDTKSGHLDMLKKIGEINGMIVNLKL